MTLRRNDFQPLIAPAGRAERGLNLFLGEPVAPTPNLAVRTGLGSTRFAAHRIPVTTACCYEARQFTRRALTDWKLHSICDDTVQIVSELVANAVRHGQPHRGRRSPDKPAVWLALALRPQTLLCVVRDPGRARPRLAAPPLLAERHRGLLIVNALSGAWGWTSHSPSGKSVWARVALPHV
ncbi:MULTISPECIES: ATP-binding protein [unclassified Streptomyces]|uniref:ATP-binding protein n=1 Tax=unclassified Streptomyces TaxID=2593676 RepID=UPI0035D74148